MNVLFVTFWYPTKEFPNKGIFIREHALALSSLNNVVVFHVNLKQARHLFKHEIKVKSNQDNMITIEFSISSLFYKFFYYFSPFFNKIFYKQFKKNLPNCFTPEIIHGNVIFPAGILTRFIARKFNIPFVISEHWSNSTKFLKSHFFGICGKRAYNDALRIFPVSHFLKNKIEPFIKDRNKLIVIPNVADNHIFNYVKKNNVSDSIQFIAVASWQKTKNFAKRPDIMIQALSEFQKHTNKKVVLHIVGNGDLIEWMKQESEQVGIKMKFHGFVSKEELAILFHKTDYLIHATNVETFSLVVAEALMTGTPVIASKVGAIPELVSKTCGVLVDNDLNNWIKGLSLLTKTKFDHKKIHSMFQQKFSTEIISKQITAAYQKVS